MTRSHLKSTTLAAILLGLASPAAAQSVCGGIGDDGIWIGGSENSSDIANADAYREQMALVLGGGGYVSLFSLSSAANVRIEAEGRGSGDPIIEVYDQNGSLVISDDDSGGNGASRAEVSLDSGLYCVSTTSFDSAPMTAFVRVGREDQEALTVGVETTSVTGGDSLGCSDARDLGTLGTSVSSQASVDDAPFLRFTLETAMPLSITANNESADPIVTLYDAANEYITENDDADGLNSRIDLTEDLPAGEYCLNVGALNDTSLPIDVAVTEYDPAAAFLALVNNAEAAPPLDGSVLITDLGDLSTRLRIDAQATSDASWFSVNVPDGGLLLAEAISIDGQGDPLIAIFDDFGRLVIANDDFGDGLDAQAAARVSSGTYFIGLREVTEGTQSFIRMGLERWVQAK